MSNEFNRRDFGVAAVATAAAAAFLEAREANAQRRGGAQGNGQGNPPAAPQLAATPPEKTVVPLPFAAGALPGLSERLLTSHHDNNYAGAVRKLNEIRQQLGAADPAQSGGYWSLYGSLKSAELAARNSALLHELYFANLGPGEQPGARVAQLVNQRFGSADRFGALMRGAAKASNGWVVLVADPVSRTLEVVQTEGHAFGGWQAEPILVLDVFEHAYALDFGADKNAYFDAFWRNVKWSEVETRTARALGRL